jgi:NAD(P)H-dependent FMN reductase
MGKQIVAVIGSYRRGGTIDSAVESILEGAREKGAETHTVYLSEQQLEFCTNCRQCMQAPGPDRGKCWQQDDLEPLLQRIDSADGIVLGSPVDFGNVTAVFRRFMERLVGYCHWPWGQWVPSGRNRPATRKAALVASATMPGFLIPLAGGACSALCRVAAMLGAKPVGSLWIGRAAHDPRRELSPRLRERARRIGWKLV